MDEERRAREEAADAAILNEGPTAVEVRSEEPPEHPAMKAAAEEWGGVGNVHIEVHRPCGMVLAGGNRDLHLTMCPSVETRFSPEQLAELKRTRYPVTREQQEEQRIAAAVHRSKSPMQRMKEAAAAREARYRAQGLRPFTVYSEGYAATGEHGGAVSHGVHWGINFNDAIARWKNRGRSDADLLSSRQDAAGRTTWTYWGCRLFDNLHDAQKSFG